MGKFKRLDPVNRRYFEEYVRHLQLRNLKPNTIEFRLWKIYGFLIWLGFRDIKKTTGEDIERFYLERKKTKSEVTAFGDLRDLRLFLNWLLPGNALFTFKPKRPRQEVPPERVLTANEVREILRACESQRDRALVMVFWDSGARLNEIMDCNIGHVTFDQYGAVISVSGKTGRRNIRLVNSVPDLQAWINIHPLKTDPNAPLFVVARRKGTVSFTRLSGRTVQNLFKRLGGLMSLGKRANPHSFRHGRLTQRGRQLTESELREYAGWSKGSNMASVYVHLSSRDIDHKILALDGVAPEQEDLNKSAVDRISCPRCRRANASDAMYCNTCSMALTEGALREIDGMKKRRADPDDIANYSDWLRRRDSPPTPP